MRYIFMSILWYLSRKKNNNTVHNNKMSPSQQRCKSHTLSDLDTNTTDNDAL